MSRFRALIAIALLAISRPAPAATLETFVETQGPTGTLKGAMLAPSETAKAPLVLIIPGSGPTDRDGDSPMGLKAASYRLLAEALASDGVASVRIDKRGMFASAGAGDPNHVTITGYAEDIHAWMLAAYRGPTLVLQGSTDLQVSAADAQRLAAARPGVKLVMLVGVNHVLKSAPLDRGANAATYADPSLPLAPGIADAIAAFVKGAGAAR